MYELGIRNNDELNPIVSNLIKSLPLLIGRKISIRLLLVRSPHFEVSTWAQHYIALNTGIGNEGFFNHLFQTAGEHYMEYYTQKPPEDANIA